MKEALETIAAFPNMNPAIEYIVRSGVHESKDALEYLPPYIVMARVAIIALGRGQQ